MKKNVSFWKKHTYISKVNLAGLLITCVCQIVILNLLINLPNTSATILVVRGAAMIIIPALAVFFSSRMASRSINKFQITLINSLSNTVTNEVEEIHPEKFSKAALVEIDRLFHFWLELFLNLFFNIPVLFYLGTVLFLAVSSSLVISFIIIFSLFLGIGFLFNFLVKNYHARHHKTYLGLLGKVRNYIENVFQFRLYNRSETYLGEVKNSLTEFSKMTATLNQFRQLYSVYVSTLLLLFLWASLWFVKSSHTFSTMSIAIVMLIFLEIRRIASDLFNNVSSFQRANESATILSQYIKQNGVDSVVNAPPKPFESILLQDFSFQYGNNQQIIKYPAIDIKAGEKILIKGPNGRGKSTLWKAITGLYSVSVNLSKHAVAEVPLGLVPVWQNMAAVTEPASCYDGFVWQIIGNFSVTKQAVETWLKDKKISHFFDGYPAKLDTFYDSALNNLSAGQLKWLLITQAFFQNPDLLILDEPMSSLDVPRQQAMLVLLAQLPSSVTLIIITHNDIDIAFDKTISL